MTCSSIIHYVEFAYSAKLASIPSHAREHFHSAIYLVSPSRLHVFTVALLRITCIRDTMLCHWVTGYQRFEWLPRVTEPSNNDNHPSNSTVSHCCIVPLLHCHTAALSHCCIVALSHSPSVTLSHCRAVALSRCPTVALSHCHVALLHCRTVTLSHCRVVPLSRCCTVALSHCSIVALSHCRTVALSHCSTVTLSHCRNVTLSHCRIPQHQNSQQQGCDSFKFQMQVAIITTFFHKTFHLQTAA